MHLNHLFDNKRKIVYTFKLQHFRKRVYLYKQVSIYQNIPKKARNSKSTSKKKHCQNWKIPNLTPPPAKMIWSSRRDAIKHGFWLLINGQRPKKIQPNKNSTHKGNPPWAFHTETFASHPRVGCWLGCWLGLSHLHFLQPGWLEGGHRKPSYQVFCSPS